MRKRTSTIRAAITITLVFAAMCAAASATSYTVVDLGALPGGSTTGRGINLAGQVVGSSGDPQSSVSRAFLWTRAGGMQSLGVLPGGDYSDAFGINRAGQIVGASNTATVMRAFIWAVGAGMQDLGALPGDTGSRALAINDSGQVVGYSSGSGVRAFLWSKTSGMQSLGTLAGGHLSEAYSINDRGQVVGVSAGYAGTLAFLWTSKTGMQALGTLAGDTASRALHINDAGLVVGSSSGPTGTHAVLWNNASIQDLGTLGGLFSEAASINNTGVVVGASTTSLGGRAFVWTSVTGMQDLNSLIPSSSGVVLTGALGVNDHGQIVAIGVVNVDTAHMVDLDDPHHAGPTHQFLLTPSGGAVAVTLYHSISQASINRGR